MIREIDGGSGFMSQNSPIAHFGLSDYGLAYEVIINWPSGTTETATDIAADQTITVVEGIPSRPTSLTLTPVYSGGFWHPRLDWTASPSEDLVGYNVYRKLYWSRKNQTSYEKQNSEPITETTWIDYNFAINPLGNCTAYYKTKAVDITDQLSNYSNTVSTTGMPGIPKEITSPVESEMPDGFDLQGNYPNPFNPVTTLRFGLPEASEVSIVVYDIMGREVIRWDLHQPPGYRQLVWNGKDHRGRLVPSGIYICWLVAASTESDKRFTASQKMLLMK